MNELPEVWFRYRYLKNMVNAFRFGSIITTTIYYDFTEEFWLGLNKTYSITKQGDYILRIELQDWKDNKRYIEYAFTLGGPETDYVLQLSRISGSIPNALPEQTELRFSTVDHDMAIINDLDCPQNYLGISMLGARMWLFPC